MLIPLALAAGFVTAEPARTPVPEESADPARVTRLSSLFASSMPALTRTDDATEAVTAATFEPGSPLPERFGAKGSTRFNVYLHAGFDVQEFEDEMAGGAIGFSRFIDDGLSLDLDFNGFFIEDRSVKSGAFSITATARWHFHEDVNWTLYAEIGAGVFIASEEVPKFASNFNFTPQAGLGATIEVRPDVRLMAGVRWHHISNASLYSENPGRDSVIGYLGLSFPF